MNPTVLVVDDSAIVLTVCRGVLEDAGFRVLTQSRANGSIAQVIWERPALMLLDVNMPDVNGDVLARMCSKISEMTGTLVVLHSSLPDTELRALVAASGAHGYIRKSENGRGLVEEIRKFLAARGMEFPATSSSATLKVAEPVAAAKPASGTYPAERVIEVEPRSVLLVDRDMTVLSQMREIVRDLGHKAEFALSVRQAGERLHGTRPPEVVVVSADMPDGGLLEVWRRALEIDARMATRVVVTTSTGLSGDVLPGFQGPVVVKPIEVTEFSRALKRAMPM